jgi:hypothetical protein
MPKGGKRQGAGRKVGSKTKKTREIAMRAAAGGITPLEFMLGIMRDENEAIEVRIDMAKAAAPYVHPKLSSIEQITKPYDLSKLNNSELTEFERLVKKIYNESPTGEGSAALN